MGSDPPIAWVDGGSRWSQYSAQIFPRNLEDSGMEHYAIFSNARDSVTFYSIVGFAGLCCDFFLHAQLFKRPQKLNSIWKNNAAPFTSLQHWGTFSHCSDISPSLTRVGLVCSNHWRNTENTFYCSAWKRKINFKEIILQILIIWQCCDRQRGDNCHSYN